MTGKAFHFSRMGAVTVVVVNWNSGVQLRACIDSVVKYGDDFVREIVVVDNCSTDGSEAGLDNFSCLKLIRTGDNLGFGRACNLGAAHAKTEFLLFLNPDAALRAGTLSNALDYMRAPENSSVGICGVQLLDERGHVSRSCARFPTAVAFAAHALALNRIFPRLGHHMSEWDHAQTRRVDHVIGAFFLVRHKLYWSLNGFDERFFVYLEDVDFSYRARAAGFLSVYLGGVQAFHAGGGTSNQVKALRLFYSLRSRLLYAFKHFSFFGALSVSLMTFLVEPLFRSAFAVLRQSASGLKETWFAYGLLWRWLPRWILKGEVR
jgi:GT2 family glycosyltransferase